MSGGFLRRLRRWFWPTSDYRRLPKPEDRPAALPDGVRVYAVGDIHGEAVLLDALIRRVVADLSRAPVEDARIVFVGDYIDRGPNSRGVLQRLAAGDIPLPFEALRGNHEDLLLRALEDVGAMPQWCRTGGAATLRSYGLDGGKLARPRVMRDLRRGLIEALPPRHLAFLRSTKLSHTIGGYFFVHAGARPGIPLDRQDHQDLMWIRDECYASPFDFGKVLVHGHTPHRNPENLPRRVNVDTGAFKRGVLTAAVLEDASRRFLSTGD